VSIGSAWAEGSWVDASWIATAWAGGGTTEIEQPSGGYLWVKYEQEGFRREAERRDRRRKKRKARKIKDKLNRELALAERAIEEGQARKAELSRITKLVEDNRESIIDLGDPQLIRAMEAAIAEKTFSHLERLERELDMSWEVAQFHEMALEILMNQ